MKLLVLGGTVFLGRHLVDSALQRGHEVTLFTRGIHNPDVYPEVEKLQGNRDGNMEALQGRTWDAVLDTSGYIPRIVKASAELLAPVANLYCFISTISVYADFSRPNFDEDTALGTLQDETVEEVTGATYGPLKVLCEKAVQEAFPGRSLIIRPGLIVGPLDHTDRFTYWPRRIAQGGEVLAPGDGNDPVQVIDGRDLADFTISMVEKGATGVYNATGPATPLTIKEVVDQCLDTTGSGANITWVSTEFLNEKEVQPWGDLPSWIPAQGPLAYMQSADIGRALDNGLTFRPLSETILDTLAYLAGRPTGPDLKAGISRDREKELLDEWHSREGQTN
jgi:2'-hydroxyisoflavone reductase